MRITGVTSRIIGYDLREAHTNGRIPEELPNPIRAVSFDTFHTDEGIDGWTMQLGGLGEGRAIGHVLHEAYAPKVLGKDPAMSRRSGRASAARTATCTTCRTPTWATSRAATCC